MNALQMRLAQPDVVSLPDWRAAEILNAPDQALPKVKAVVSGKDVQEILLSSRDWAKIVMAADKTDLPDDLRGVCIIVRDTVKQASVIRMDDPLIFAETQFALGALVQVGLIKASTRDLLMALSERAQSWAEANKIEVTARSVGLARGGV